MILGLAVGALLFAGSRAPAPDRPTLVLATLAAVVAGAAYRPWTVPEALSGRQGVGLGTLLLPLALARLGGAATGWVVLLTHPLRAGLRFLLRRPAHWASLPEAAGRDALALLAAASVLSIPDESPSLATVIGAGAIYVLLRGGLEWGLARWTARSVDLRALAIRDLLPEAAAWGLGAVLPFALVGSGETPILVLLLVFAGLGLEAARQLALRRRADASRSALLDLGIAGTRLAHVQPGMEEVAQRVFVEARRVLPCPWIELSLDRPTIDGESVWRLGPTGPIAPLAAEPPDHPPPRPGIHRRVRWKRLERRLESGDEILGQLRLWCDPREVSRDELTLFDSLLPQLASLVHRARLDEEASRDPLTGTALRRVLDETLVSAFSRSRANGRSLSVVLVDLDFFKRINDRWGHGAGDEALRTVARVLGRNLRDRDLCARYGGEEFTLLLEGLDGGAALAVAERLRSEVEELVIEHDGEELPVTLSAGVASFPEIQARSGTELLELADAALYQAKDRGRNRCLLYLGRGRYRDPDGAILEKEGAEPSEPRAPRIFV